ncbi:MULTISPECIES: NAD-dependent epimerase/dehydratase family protein [Cryobacterium]|uniref:NAD-dependent epimerase/dehydratase family protein n=1 Tax=Cryobacterium breve TaxID=1259258 RepID=A0ABY2IZ32_9MICO|nr:MULTISPECIES: NAD-dependent epimerase/dehydratase family protein [Cryobacterium]TFC94748.1 NAD-dependent epimerase/dehydratase family protein [Cryobacterium sp. TmT3-12]TFC96362.1 NAD-dependent epimerase/dehydratase family protein [Cryobacterium breve]
MTVLIAGCGDLGTEVGLRFAALGHTVVGLRRNAAVLPAAIQGQSVDLSAHKPVVPADTEIVIVAIAAGNRDPVAYRAAYVDGVRNLLDAFDEVHVMPRRVLLVSSTAVYNVTDESWVDEQTPANPKPGTDAILVEAEQLLHARIPHAVIFRLSGIYGPGRERLITQVRAGRATLSASARHTNRIHRDDAAAAIVHLMLREEEPAPLYLGVDSAPVRSNEVLVFLAEELGLPAPAAEPTPGPKPRPAGEPPATRESRRGGDKRLRNRLLLDTGFTFSYPTYREGYRAVLAGGGIRHP